MKKIIALVGILTLIVDLLSVPAFAQIASTRATTLVVPFAPGGGTDVLARALAPKMAEMLGTSVIIDNRPGAGGVTAAMLTLRAAPDGKTLMVGSSGEFAINPGLFPKLPYDVSRDFTAVTPIASTPMVLVVHPSSQIRTVKDLVNLAQANPGKINFGSGGNGSGSHMATELFLYSTKTKLTHIPYKGSGPALADLIGTQQDMVVFTSLASGSAMIRSGQVRAVAISSRHRISGYPDVPTFIESGIPGYEMEYWYGMMGPASMSTEIRARIHTVIVNILNQAEIIANLSRQGVQPMNKTPDEFSAFIIDDMERWRALVKSANIKLDL